MTKVIIMLSGLLVVFCGASGTLTGKWKLIQYKDLSTGQTEYEPNEYKDLPGLTFNFQDNDSAGTFKGRTIINETQGEYILKPNNKIMVERFGGTKVGGEPAWATKFWRTIRESSSYKIHNDTLIIFYDNDTKSMVFAKRP